MFQDIFSSVCRRKKLLLGKITFEQILLYDQKISVMEVSSGNVVIYIHLYMYITFISNRIPSRPNLFFKTFIRTKKLK